MIWEYNEKYNVYTSKHGWVVATCYREKEHAAAFITINTSANPRIDHSRNIWTRDYSNLSAAKRGCARVLRELLSDVMKVLTEML